MQKELKTLHNNGYDFVNKANYYKFKRFMQNMRDNGLIDAYGSNRIVEIFPAVETINQEEMLEVVNKLFDAYDESL